MTKKKLRKTEEEVKEELTTLLFDEKDEPGIKELQKKAENARKCEDTIVIVASMKKY